MAPQFSPLASFLSGGKNDDNIQRENQLKLRGKTLIFGNTIYQVSNISAIEVVDLTTVKKFPSYILLIGLVGLFFFFLADDSQIWGILLLALAGFLYYNWNQSKTNERYGLSIVTNAGALGSATLVSPDFEFLKKVAVTINNLMNTADENTGATFVFDQRKIEVENMTNSQLVGGDVSGDLVNRIE